MIKKIIVTILVFAAFAFGRDISRTTNPGTSSVSSQSGESVEVDNNFTRTESNREDIILFEYDFEGDETDWIVGDWWELSDTEYNSPTHSFNSPNPPGGENLGLWSLYSPVLSLPDVGDGEVMRFGFSLFDNQPDSDGDGDNSLEDYYRVSLADVDALAWHIDDFNAYSGESYWCGDEEFGGYLDGWLQFLDSPEFNIPSTGYELSAQLKWGLEDWDGAGGVSGHFVDGWDAANVRISTDGGDTWDILEGSDPYDFTSGYGWINNGEPDYIPGWGGIQDWHNVTFDLDDYAGENVIIRFAFGSDPAFSVIDDSALIGFFVDDIEVSNTAGNDLLLSNGDDSDEMSPSGLVWVDQFYDYGGDEANPRPGFFGWEEYLPGYPFCTGCNVFLDISEFGGKNVVFRFVSIYDDNDDGGNGGGLFIDDFKIYKELGAPPAPTGLEGESLAGGVSLWWDDMNYIGTDDIVYDNDDFDPNNGIIINGEDTAYAGALFNIVGASTINDASFYNVNGETVNVTIGAYPKVGAFFNTSAAYEMDVTMTAGWNDFTLNWEMNSAYILSVTFDANIASSLDITVPSDHSMVLLGGAWDTWYDTVEGSGGALNHGEWGIRANVTQYGADATYNVYRDEVMLVAGLTDAMYDDFDVQNNITYIYAVSAVFPSGEESELSEGLEITPQSATVHELAHDDGSAETGWQNGSGNYTAVRFTAAAGGEDVVRAKWYQVGDGGAFYFYLWEDDNGLPGAAIDNFIVLGGVDGWNDFDLSTEGMVVEGDFWLGVREFSSTQPFGLDTDSDSGNTYFRIGGDGNWELLSSLGISGNLMLRIFLDGGEIISDCVPGDVNGDENIDVLDIVTIVNFIMGQDTPDDDEFCASDYNEDGTIDVLDIVALVNFIMNP